MTSDAATRPPGPPLAARDSRPWLHALVLVLLIAAVVGIQLFVGAYGSERGNYPDEAVHFMNGLLLRDYLTHGRHVAPFAFASDYYLDYPKIAPGMWPPLFHVILGVILLPGWSPHAAALALIALITALIAWRLHLLLRASPAAALLVPAIFLTVPVVVEMSTAVMVDGLVAALALEATCRLSRYVDGGARRDAVAFGICAALCCLSKGNGMVVPVVVPVLIVLTGRIDLLRRRDLYLAAAIVVVLAGPMLALSSHLDAKNSDFAPVGFKEAFDRLALYGGFLWSQLGPIAAVIAGAACVRAAWPRSSRSIFLEGTMPAALVSLVVATLAFHALTWHRTTADRYMMMAVAPLTALLPYGVESLWLAARRWSAGRRLAVLRYATIGSLIVALHPITSARQPLGYRVVSRFLASNDALARRRILVVSDEDGEGSMVSEIAALHPDPPATIVRGSKLLADSDWNGNHFRLLYDSPGALLERLEALHIDFVTIDNAALGAAFPYGRDLASVLEQHADRVDLVYRTNPGDRDGPKRAIAVYRLKFRGPGAAAPLRVSLQYTLGRTLER